MSWVIAACQRKNYLTWDKLQYLHLLIKLIEKKKSKYINLNRTSSLKNCLEELICVHELDFPHFPLIITEK